MIRPLKQMKNKNKASLWSRNYKCFSFVSFVGMKQSDKKYSSGKKRLTSASKHKLSSITEGDTSSGAWSNYIASNPQSRAERHKCMCLLAALYGFHTLTKFRAFCLGNDGTNREIHLSTSINLIKIIHTPIDRHAHRPTQCKLASRVILNCVKLTMKANNEKYPDQDFISEECDEKKGVFNNKNRLSVTLKERTSNWS